jgi:pimeloyl-ACP methyl ester carboxylesterase
MAVMEHAGARIEYSVTGSGHPLTLFAPGGMNSVAQLWLESPAAPGVALPWIDPRTALSDHFLVIAMDQRNAGGSSGPVSAEDGWETYAGDQMALLDHLGVDETHLMGGCIGSSFCLGFIKRARARVAAAVLQNPIGLTADNRADFYSLFDSWAKDLQATRPDVTSEALAGMRENMFGGDFVFSVDREWLRQCPVPLLVLAGNDQFHPRAAAEEIAALAPDARLVVDWAGPERSDRTRQLVLDFLSAHTSVGP